MRTSTAFNHQQRILSRLSGLLSGARIYGTPSRELDDRTREIFASLPKNCPRWVRDYVRGWLACERGHMDQELVFCFAVGGILYSNRSDRADYYGHHGFSARDVHERATSSGHYWDCRGELRPYFVSSPA